jgi:Flp pilus assembly secretin CpaC
MPGKTRTCSHRLARGTVAALVLAVWAVAGFVPAAFAASTPTITVKSDQATIVALAGDPATVIIGNSLFADITLKKGMIVIHGRQWGTTNVIILDKENEELANFELSVVRGGSQNVMVRKGISSFSYLCAPSCEGALQVGDNADHFGSISSAMATKLQLSTGATDIGDKE